MALLMPPYPAMAENSEPCDIPRTRGRKLGGITDVCFSLFLDGSTRGEKLQCGRGASSFNNHICRISIAFAACTLPMFQLQ